MTVEAIVWNGRGPRRLSDTTGLTQLANGVVFYQGQVRHMDEAGMAGVDLADTDPLVIDDTVPERVRRYSLTDEASAPPPPPPSPPPGLDEPPGSLLYRFDTPAEFNDGIWSNNGLTLTSAGVSGPDGTGDATTVAATGGAFRLHYFSAVGLRRIRAKIKAVAGQPFPPNFYFFANIDPGSAFTQTWFDPSDGSVLGDNIGTADSVSLGGGWYHVEAVATVASGGAIGFGISGAGGGLGNGPGNPCEVLIYEYEMWDG